jgi:hypothetical protein
VARRADFAVDLETAAEAGMVSSAVVEASSLRDNSRLVVERLVPFLVLPWVLSGMETVVRSVSFFVANAIVHNIPHQGSIRKHSPFFRGRHGIDIAAVEVVVPRDGSDGESGGTDGESIRLPGRSSTLGC